MTDPEDVVEAASRFVCSPINGRALAIGPKVSLDDDGHLLPPTSKEGKQVTSFEVHAHDFEEVEAFTARYVGILNAVEAGKGWLGWAADIVKAVFYPFSSR